MYSQGSATEDSLTSAIATTPKEQVMVKEEPNESTDSLTSAIATMPEEQVRVKEEPNESTDNLADSKTQAHICDHEQEQEETSGGHTCKKRSKVS